MVWGTHQLKEALFGDSIRLRNLLVWENISSVKLVGSEMLGTFIEVVGVGRIVGLKMSIGH